MQKKILIIYHSGSGSTRTISEVLKDRLSNNFKVDLVKICLDFDYEGLSDYDQVLLGYPTYYFKPSLSTLEFVDRMPVFRDKVQFFIFTTYGLYSGNSIRTLSKMLQNKNIVIKGYSQIRGPASDGVLLLPSFFRLFFKYEKKADTKIDKMINVIKENVKGPKNNSKTPSLRWYSPITGLFSRQIHGIDYSAYKKNLKVLEDRCTNCNICVEDCIRNCWTGGKDFPLINTGNCEFCLKCVHNCPAKAIIFTDRMKDSPRLDKSFYSKLKQNTFQ